MSCQEVFRRLSRGGGVCRGSQLNRARDNRRARRAGGRRGGCQRAVDRGGGQRLGNLGIRLEGLRLGIVLGRAAVVARLRQLVGIIYSGLIQERAGVVKVGGNQMQLLQNLHRLPPV